MVGFSKATGWISLKHFPRSVSSEEVANVYTHGTWMNGDLGEQQGEGWQVIMDCSAEREQKQN